MLIKVKDIYTHTQLVGGILEQVAHSSLRLSKFHCDYLGSPWMDLKVGMMFI